MRKPNRKKASCHPDKPHYAKGFCNNCYAKHLKKENPELAERQRINATTWIKKHLEKNPAYRREIKSKSIKKNGGAVYQRKLDLKKMYGITPEQYLEMYESQNGCCYICGKPEGTRKLSVDHCHESKKVRGLLCLSCNCGLGYFKDSIENLYKAIDYLVESRK